MMSNRSRDDFDRLMTGWMEADGRVREPEGLIGRVLERTAVAVAHVIVRAWVVHRTPP